MNEQPKPSQESSRSQAHILVVDDNEMNRDLLFRRLFMKGFHIDVAEDGFITLDQITHDACNGLVKTKHQMSVRPNGFDEDVNLFDVAGIGEPYNLDL